MKTKSIAGINTFRKHLSKFKFTGVENKIEIK